MHFSPSTLAHFSTAQTTGLAVPSTGNPWVLQVLSQAAASAPAAQLCCLQALRPAVQAAAALPAGSRQHVWAGRCLSAVLPAVAPLVHTHMSTNAGHTLGTEDVQVGLPALSWPSNVHAL